MASPDEDKLARITLRLANLYKRNRDINNRIVEVQRQREALLKEINAKGVLDESPENRPCSLAFYIDAHPYLSQEEATKRWEAWLSAYLEYQKG